MTRTLLLSLLMGSYTIREGLHFRFAVRVPFNQMKTLFPFRADLVGRQLITLV